MESTNQGDGPWFRVDSGALGSSGIIWDHWATLWDRPRVGGWTCQQNLFTSFWKRNRRARRIHQYPSRLGIWGVLQPKTVDRIPTHKRKHMGEWLYFILFLLIFIIIYLYNHYNILQLCLHGFVISKNMLNKPQHQFIDNRFSKTTQRMANALLECLEYLPAWGYHLGRCGSHQVLSRISVDGWV
jgi:hypothetical protein